MMWMCENKALNEWMLIRDGNVVMSDSYKKVLARYEEACELEEHLKQFAIIPDDDDFADEYDDYDQDLYDYSGNMPCDTYGMCAGTSCPNYWNCQGK